MPLVLLSPDRDFGCEGAECVDHMLAKRDWTGHREQSHTKPDNLFAQGTLTRPAKQRKPSRTREALKPKPILNLSIQRPQTCFTPVVSREDFDSGACEAASSDFCRLALPSFQNLREWQHPSGEEWGTTEIRRGPCSIEKQQRMLEFSKAG